MLGWDGKGLNPNHVTTDYECRGCRRKFFVHAKSGNIWVTDEASKVLKGIPTCFETFIYTCVKCGGNVERKYTAKDGVSDVKGLCSRNINGTWVKEYCTFYRCVTCGHGGEVDSDYPRETG